MFGHLDVQHIKKIYKTWAFKGTQVEALKDIHFTVEKGEHAVIMCETRSGKSPSALAMLDQPTEGVYLDGHDTSTIKKHGRFELWSGKTRLGLRRFFQLAR